MKPLHLIIAVGLVVAVNLSLALAVRSPRDYEYRVVEFSREQSADDRMDGQLTELARDHWDYVGPLANNGINATFILWRRPK